MRAVFDPNVLVSALISSDGPPRAVVDAWEAGHIDLVVCPHLLDELEGVLLREKILCLPPFVVTDEQKRRWVLSAKAARNVAEQIGGDEVTVFLATRSLYKSDIPTDPPDEEVEQTDTDE